MKQFIKIRAYCQANCCFDDIKTSSCPAYIVNIQEIAYLGPRETFGYITGHWNYPFHRLSFSNGKCYLITPESAEKLIKELEI